jgi:hypothetical protein
MDMKFFKKLLLIWMIAWLPAAGALAAVMPLSGSMKLVVTTDAPMAELEMSAMPCHGKSLTGKASFGQSCSHCVLCHLAGALVAPEVPIVAASTPTHLFDVTTIVVHPSFIPELTAPPPRPPLA